MNRFNEQADPAGRSGPPPRTASNHRTGRPGDGQGALGARLLAAVVGGYAVANLGAIALGVLLPIARVDAVYIGLLASFALYAAAVVWGFAAATACRAWLGLAVAAAPCLAVIGAAPLAGGS